MGTHAIFLLRLMAGKQYIKPALDRSHLRGEPTWPSRTGTAARGSRGKSGNPMGRRLLIYLNGRLK